MYSIAVVVSLLSICMLMLCLCTVYLHADAMRQERMADACGKMCCACVVVLTAIRSNNNEMPFVGSSAWISLTDALSPWILP